MAVTYNESLQWQREHIATGYITAFAYPGHGELNLDQDYTQVGGALNGKKLRIRPLSKVLAVPQLVRTTITRSDGTVYSPWALAGKRPPVSFARYTQTFVYSGNVDLVQQFLAALTGRIGLAGTLTFSYGRANEFSFGKKYCLAQMEEPSGLIDRNWKDGVSAMTHTEITVSWQQLGKFTW